MHRSYKEVVVARRKQGHVQGSVRKSGVAGVAAMLAVIKHLKVCSADELETTSHNSLFPLQAGVMLHHRSCAGF